MSTGPLTPAEKARVESMLPVLERAARRSRRLPREESYSAGYEGLVKAVRTHDDARGELQAWAVLCVQNAVADAWKNECRRRVRVHQLDHDPVDRSTIDQSDARLDAIEELPPVNRDVVFAFLRVGNVDGIAAELGVTRAEARSRFAEAKKILRSGGV